MNFQAWSNFLGQCVIAFLLVEGVKAIIFGLRSPRRSFWRIGLNLLAGAGAAFFIVPASGLFPWAGAWRWVAVIIGALVTAGIHRVVKRLRPALPSPVPI